MLELLSDDSDSDDSSEEEMIDELKEALKKIEKCKLPGRYKVWMIEHMVILRLVWPLSIYNIPMSQVQEMQRLLTIKVKKWLPTPKFEPRNPERYLSN